MKSNYQMNSSLDSINSQKVVNNQLNKFQQKILCPRCNTAPKRSFLNYDFNTHICQCGNTFWTLNECPNPNCQHPYKTISNQKPKAGEVINCFNCNFSFHIFRCPNKKCEKKFWMKKGQYRMGQILRCDDCQLNYKLIVCSCGGQSFKNYNQKILEGHSPQCCKQCNKTYYFTICTDCLKTNYYQQPLEVSEKITCSHCKKKRAYVPCPNCFRTIQTLKFSFCEPNQCNFCKTKFEFTKCPYCYDINHFSNENMTEKIRFCNGNNCKGRQYIAISCLKCHQSIYIQEYTIGAAYKDSCPTCRNILQYYFCSKCNKLNTSGLNCSNNSCPKPAQIISYVKQSKIENNTIIQNLNTNYQEKQCKLCCDAQSTMINMNCSHIMMCKQCYESYKRKYTMHTRSDEVSKNTMPCPVCKRIGFFIQFKKPLFC